MCVQVCKKNKNRKRKKKRRDRDREGETFCPYVPRILGQLAAEYLKDAVYLTCGRQLLTLCCTEASARTHTHTLTRNTCVHHAHFVMKTTEKCSHLLMHKKMCTHAHTHRQAGSVTHTKHNHTEGSLNAPTRLRRRIINSPSAHCWKLTMIFSLNSTLKKEET